MADYVTIVAIFIFIVFVFGLGFMIGGRAMSKHIRSENIVTRKEADSAR
jgi:uncharacterized protein YneF (UPF0154 family)